MSDCFATSPAPGPENLRKLRILLVDDHAVLREGLKSFLDRQSNMVVVGEAESGESACHLIQNMSFDERPEIVVMDISLPGMNGAQATAEIKREFSQIQVLALSMHEHESYLFALLEAGASGYLLKRSAAQELVRALHFISAGGTYLDPAVAGKIATHFLRRPFGLRLRGEMAGRDLHEREADVLRLVAQGYSSKEISAKIGIGQKTIESHKQRGMEKIGIHSRAEIVRYAVLKGWLENSV